MTYTNVWNETLPLGSAARNTVDDIFRQGKLDMRERLVPLVFTDMSLDPLVLNPAILGNVVGKIMPFHWSDFDYSQGAGGSVAGTDGNWWEAGDGTNRYAGIRLPAGAVITKASFKIFPNGAGTMSCKMVRSLWSNTVVADVFPQIDSTAGVPTVVDSGVISHTVDALYSYWLVIDIPASGARIFGGYITYTVADSRITL